MQIGALVKQLAQLLGERGETLAVAESCTGGWVGQAITAQPGSSQWFSAGITAYSNDAKQRLLGVSEETLRDHGAVSGETASEMARGALREGRADWSLAITGIAGPDGGTEARPVGTVWFAWAGRDYPCDTRLLRLEGDRRAVRVQSVAHALQGLIERVRTAPRSASRSPRP